jgi:hypothetical protein
MDDKPLPEPLELSFNGEKRSAATVRELYDLMTTQWPEDARGPRYRDAVDTALKVLDGHRSVVDLVAALKEARTEAGLPEP